jgi:hypothetical protein
MPAGVRVFALSLLFYIASLLLSGYYTGPTQQDNYGFVLLLTGWLGAINAHFSWFANPLYFWALKIRKTNPRGAVLRALLAFCVALEFLLHRSILTDEGSGTATITGVGWGYLFWLLSFLTLCLSSLSGMALRTKREATALLALMGLVITCFGYSYYFAKNNHSALVRERDRQFAALCTRAGEAFFAEPSAPISGIYFSEAGGGAYSKFILGRYTVTEGAMFSSRGLPQIPLVEMRNFWHDATTPYLRESGKGGKSESVTELKSNYFVIISKLSDKMPLELGLQARAMYVFEKGGEQPLAQMVYAISSTDHRFCGPVHNDRFDEIDFVFRALKLTR